MPSCGGLALEAEVEPEFEVEDELEDEASCFGGFFVVFCCVGFLRSSCLLRSGGAEAKAFFALAGKAFGSAATGATGADGGAARSSTQCVRVFRVLRRLAGQWDHRAHQRPLGRLRRGWRGFNRSGRQ